jgi:hypothetical protein
MEWQRRCTAPAWLLARGVAGGLGLAGEVADHWPGLYLDGKPP